MSEAERSFARLWVRQGGHCPFRGLDAPFALNSKILRLRARRQRRQESAGCARGVFRERPETFTAHLIRLPIRPAIRLAHIRRTSSRRPSPKSAERKQTHWFRSSSTSSK